MAVLIRPGVHYGTLMVLAVLAGVGGGNFASSMANINAFYPERLKGRALGLNAGGGNIGVATVQLVGLAVLAFAGATHPGLVVGVYLPLIVVAALCAALFMDNLRAAANPERAMRDALRQPHTYVMSLLYIGTFGSFIGFGFALGQVLQVQFHLKPLDAAYVTWLGPLVGSLVRPVGGALADRWRGSRVTLAVFVAMAGCAGLVLLASARHSEPLFLVGFVALFALSGIGNGSTYKMIPAIFDAAYLADKARARRVSAALIGIAGAVGAGGGLLVNVALRQSFLTEHNGDAAYLGFIAFYGLCVVVTWAVYLRPGARGALPGV
jgi:NNP family nitrate/nitrite transporter-like MFS transporter